MEDFSDVKISNVLNKIISKINSKFAQNNVKEINLI